MIITTGPPPTDNPLFVVPLCRRRHRAYDRGELDLLAHL
jgi:hypothetical protein